MQVNLNPNTKTMSTKTLIDDFIFLGCINARIPDLHDQMLAELAARNPEAFEAWQASTGGLPEALPKFFRVG